MSEFMQFVDLASERLGGCVVAGQRRIFRTEGKSTAACEAGFY